MGQYGVGQICLNGHRITKRAPKQPSMQETAAINFETELQSITRAIPRIAVFAILQTIALPD